MRALIALAPFAILAACETTGSVAQTTAPAGVDATVQMTSAQTFSPNAVTIRSGETVAFQNISTFGHSVSTEASTPAEQQVTRLPSGAAAFDSGVIAPGETYTYTFTTPGTYRYFSESQVANGMVGTVIVNP
ncbi:hypothetical protein EU805_05155 [Salipiger sp. IMCC34102]|uniref:cupredoxin domain-containing protein n=1 Tax=Salipiger sp. IMCC34102 TaxID=2510647 RepID=UPI00101BA9E3|nr:plastocyanin/azurin family copper-binding protein [Salipiger sp. IMCC34102]RYH03121.1 hypothetical protein EU805_05155 [Salipiger sp. IMCC34102]